MAKSTGRVSVAFVAPRNHFVCLKPARVCFSDAGPFPNRKIVTPRLASSSSLNRIFAPRPTKPATTSRATNGESSMILQGEDEKPITRDFPMVYCGVGFM